MTRSLNTPVMRAVNNFMIQHVVKATATQNDDGEAVGVVNHISSYIYTAKGVFKRMKQVNRQLYYAAKYTLIGGILYLIYI